MPFAAVSEHNRPRRWHTASPNEAETSQSAVSSTHTRAWRRTASTHYTCDVGRPTHTNTNTTPVRFWQRRIHMRRACKEQRQPERVWPSQFNSMNATSQQARTQASVTNTTPSPTLISIVNMPAYIPPRTSNARQRYGCQRHSIGAQRYQPNGKRLVGPSNCWLNNAVPLSLYFSRFSCFFTGRERCGAHTHPTWHWHGLVVRRMNASHRGGTEKTRKRELGTYTETRWLAGGGRTCWARGTFFFSSASNWI